LGENRLWLLAHQDDEVLALHLHSNSVNNFVVYLTNGVRTGATYESGVRVQEAQSAWSGIDRNAELIFFGTQHYLRDGELQNQLSHSHLHELISICHVRKINEIVTLQLEGGHQDHDITSMLAEELSRRLSLKLITFPGYRALHKRFAVYTVMSSWIKQEARKSLPVATRIRLANQSLTLMKRYGSQLTTWIGLGPFVFLKYLLGSPTYLLLADRQNAAQDFPKKLLYVNRMKHEKIDYEGFQKKLSSW
jgi:hypothetical protein